MTGLPRIELGGPEALDLAAIAPVYAAAFAEPPYSEPDAGDLLRRAPRHAARDGFAVATARDAAEQVVGFAYGLRARSGGWTADLVEDLEGAFELVELAVRPTARGRGIGAALLATMLQHRREPRVVLQTHDGDSAAMRLYDRFGFRRVGSAPVGVALVKDLR